jgi:hypothetical protein
MKVSILEYFLNRCEIICMILKAEVLLSIIVKHWHLFLLHYFLHTFFIV